MDERGSGFDTVISGRLEEKGEHLENNDLSSDVLVEKLADEPAGSEELGLVVSAEGFSELEHESVEEELSHKRQFRVDDGDERGVHAREQRRGLLGLHQGPAEKATSSDEVLLKELLHNRGDVGGVDFVDEAVDRLSQSLPRYPLVLWVGLVALCILELLLSHFLESLRRDVDASAHGPRDNFLSFFLFLFDFLFLSRSSTRSVLGAISPTTVRVLSASVSLIGRRAAARTTRTVTVSVTT